MRKVFAAFLCAAMVFASVRAGEASNDTSSNAGVTATGGPFILVDQNGRSVTDEDFRGNYLLIAFGYTHCPDVCPTTLMTLASTLHDLGPEAEAVTPIFISLDPDRDTPERMKEYVESFGPRFIALTGPAPYIENIAQKYHVKYTKAAGAPGDYSIDHTAAIFLVGPDGAFIQRFPYDIEARALALQLHERLRALNQ
jgi:protein SCO1/2